MPVTASKVITAPLCGKVSMPPEAASDASTVEYFERNARRLCVLDEETRHGRQRDAHAARGRPG